MASCRKLKERTASSATDKSWEGNTVLESTDTDTTKTSRGRTQMDKLARRRVQGIRKDVRFNKLGQPIGEAAVEMQSYIGVLAREKVKISYKTWKQVPSDVKELIWESVNLTYNVDPSWKKGCLNSANNKWRQYKTHLTKTFILSKLDKPEELNEPPTGYGITRDDWSSFVISRMSDDFIKLSNQQKERRKQNIYPHRLARKGYARYAEEIADELCDDDEINRAIIWKKGRVTKEGEFEGDDLKMTVEKIDDYVKQKCEGTLKLEGRKKDILTKALDSEEHAGRVRGVGGHITPTMYFNVGRMWKSAGVDKDVIIEHKKELMEVKKLIVEQDARIQKLEAMVYKKGARDIDDKSSCSIKFHEITEKENKSNKSVPSYEDLDNDDMYVVTKADALQKSKRKKSDHEMKNQTLSSSVPRSLRMLYCYCKHALVDGGNISLILDHDVFDDDYELRVHLEDIIPLYHLEPISVNCIAVYMWHLYKKMIKDNKVEKFRFVNPHTIFYLQITTYDKRGKTARLNQMASVLADRLSGASISQLVLVPCNISRHWILTVIEPYKEVVYLLDSLSHRIRNEDWKYVVDMALRLFNSNKGRKGKKHALWEVVQAPRQPDAKQCAYYVMRYMRQIIEEVATIERNSLRSIFTKPEYSREEIDEVRSECAECIQDHIYG